MASIAPIPATRVNDLLIHRRLLSQFQLDQQELFRVQTQLSTGRRIQLPSEDAPAALRAGSLQSLIERKQQIGENLKTGESFLVETESALQTTSNVLVDMRALALSAVDTVATDGHRAAVAEEVDQALETLVAVANKRTRGRYLFAGSLTATQPFEMVGPYVQYFGNEATLESYSDIDLLFETNLHGNDVFGVISEPIRGTTDLNPVVTPDSRLGQLNGGLGVSAGSVAVSDGTSTSIVDLTGAVTMADVAQRLQDNPPDGRTVVATITPTGLQVELDGGGGTLSITEVGGGSTARELGILEEDGAANNKVQGADLNPRLSPTTRLDDILGSRAYARLASPDENNDLLIQASVNGTDGNGVRIQLVDDGALQAAPGLGAGSEIAEFDTSPRSARASLALDGPDNDLVITAVNPGTDFNNVAIELVDAGDVKNNPSASYLDFGGVRRLTLGIDDTDETTLDDLVSAINATGVFTAAPDPSNGEGYNGGSPVRTANAGVIKGNTTNSGGSANTLYVRIRPGSSKATDVAAAINAEGTFTAQTVASDAVANNQIGIGKVDVAATATTAGGSGTVLDKQGIRVVNGGQTFDVTFDDAETVEDLLNHLNAAGAGLLAEINADGTGLDVRSTLSGANFAIGELGGSTATQLGIRTFRTDTSLDDLNKGQGVEPVSGTDLVVERNDGVQLEIDISGAKTVGDVIDAINGHPGNQDAAAVLARLAQYGNGIELVDDNPSGVDPLGQPNQLKVRTANESLAAIHLGLVPEGQQISTPTSPAVASSGDAVLAGSNNDLVFTATAPGTQFDGTSIELTSGTATGDQALVSYDGPSGTLFVDIDPGVTRAQTIVNAVNTEGTFSASLLTQLEPNDGTGTVSDLGQVAVTDSGAAETLTGADVHPRETEGVFNTLIRLREALLANDIPEIERSLELLEEDSQRTNFARADLGARQQGVHVLQDQLDGQKIELRAALSDEIDVDLAEAISELTARQAAFQASLQATGSILQLSLLNFL